MGKTGSGRLPSPKQRAFETSIFPVNLFPALTFIVTKSFSNERAPNLDQNGLLNHFLAGVERRAFRMALIAVRDEENALDIVQEAMFAFVRRYRERPEGEWRPLFQRVLQSRITDAVRRKTVRERFRVWFGFAGDDDEGISSDPIQELPDATLPDQLSLLENRGFSAALEKALRKLPFRQQQAFLLRFWEEFDVKQTARVMGCSEGSVKTHTSRALHTLRGLLEEYKP
jgi:RNA polymerase sigma-70 factor (ECF subfamily)